MKVNQLVWVLMLAGVTAVKLPAQTLQTLCPFNFTNGAYPLGLTLGNDGNFYGTTSLGGITNSANWNGMGTIFRLTTNGTFTTLVAFNFTNGAYPAAALTLGNDGNFYGTTDYGGVTNSTFPSGMGTVFKVTTNGTFTALVSFNFTNGAYPVGALTLGNDGNFYGTTQGGGNTNFNSGLGGGSGCGTVFKVTTNGTLTTLASFASTNGAWPVGALTLGKDDNFYGVTQTGGITNSANENGMGTIFQVTMNGKLTALISFNGNLYPNALTLGNDGNFYGTTMIGGITNSANENGMGTIFRLTTNGTFTTLVAFNFTNGAYPAAALTLGNDGNFYGITPNGGITNSENPFGMGTVFQVTTNGMLTTLVSFSPPNGLYPVAALTLGNDGNFYGTTQQGGNTNLNSGYGWGTMFRLLVTPGPPVIATQPVSQTNIVGTTVTFLVNAWSLQPMIYQWQFNGTNLAGATNTTLALQNAFPANAGAYTVAVTNAYGSVTSNPAMLTVLPLGIAAPTMLASGQFQFSFDTVTGVNYAVQCSTNLTQWFPLVTLGGIGVPLTLIDPNAVGSQQRFYRIILSPQ